MPRIEARRPGRSGDSDGPPGSLGLDRLLEDGRWSGFQKRLLVLAALAFAVDGLANQVLGLAIPALVRDWGAPREAFAPVAALGLVGVAVGTIVGGILADRWGRRIGLTVSVLLFGVMTTATAFVHGVGGLMLLRLLAGLGIGGALPNGAALIAEFTPARQRSLGIAIGMVFIPVGAVLSGILGAEVLPAYGWRGLFFICGVLPTVLGLAFLAALPESPRFLARLPRRRDELIALLRRCGHEVDPETTMSLAGASAESRAVAASLEMGARARASVAALLGPGMTRDTLALWIAFFFCLLASYTLFSWVPSMLAGQGFGLRMTSVGMTVFNVGGMIGGVGGGWLIGRFGSRQSVLALAGGSIAGALALGTLPLDPHHGVPLAMAEMVFEGFCIGGLTNGLYTLATFIYPPAIRGTGVGAAAGTGRIGAVLSSFTGVLTLELGGASSYFIVVAATLAIAFAATALIGRQIPRSDARQRKADPTALPEQAGSSHAAIGKAGSEG